jgi:predicted P-loop ATPase
LAQFKRGDIEMIKAFISRRFEQFRPSYGRHEIKFPRQCVFAGTTNAPEYLVDQTGNRRFWGVACRRVDIIALARDRDQIRAEALALDRAGVPWYLSGSVSAMAATEAGQRVAHDPWTAQVAGIIDRAVAYRSHAPEKSWKKYC